MPTIPYLDEDGKRIPGVTTVIGSNLGWNTGALMYWSWNEGKEGRNYRETSKSACTVGTLVHSCVEADINGKPPPIVPPEFQNEAENALLGWLHWRDMVKFKPLHTEISLVDSKLGFGGTLDLVSIMDRPVLSDLKTSKGIYPDHKIQIATYGYLWENADRQYLEGKWIDWEKPTDIEGLALLQVGKQDGSFHYHFWHSLPEAWEAFTHCLALHKLAKKLK